MWEAEILLGNDERGKIMKVRQLKRVLIWLGSATVLLGCVSAQYQNSNEHISTPPDPTQTPSDIRNTDCETLKFRFVTIADNADTTKSRRVDVFLEDKSFTVDNLKGLLLFMSRKYNDTPSLLVEVNTDWSQIEFPSDCPGTGISGRGPNGVSRDGHNYALLYRRDGTLYFNYTADAKSPKLTTVKVESNK